MIPKSSVFEARRERLLSKVRSVCGHTAIPHVWSLFCITLIQRCNVFLPQMPEDPPTLRRCVHALGCLENLEGMKEGSASQQFTQLPTEHCVSSFLSVPWPFRVGLFLPALSHVVPTAAQNLPAPGLPPSILCCLPPNSPVAPKSPGSSHIVLCNPALSCISYKPLSQACCVRSTLSRGTEQIRRAL